MRQSTGHSTKPEGENAIPSRRFRPSVSQSRKNTVRVGLTGKAGIGSCLDYNDWNSYYVFSCGYRHLGTDKMESAMGKAISQTSKTGKAHSPRIYR